MSSHNIAFALPTQLNHTTGMGIQVQTAFVVFSPEGEIVGQDLRSCFVTIGYSDSAQSINEKIADSIRDQLDDQEIFVTFVGSPGRY